jgi:PAS domain S-box-containing protein
MTNSLADTIQLHNNSYWNIIDSLVAETNTALLAVDSDSVIIAVNPGYQRFHSLFSSSALGSGQAFSDADLVSYPPEFISIFRKMFCCNSDEGKVTMRLTAGNGSRFSVSFITIITHGVFDRVLALVREINPGTVHVSSRPDQFFKLLVDTSTSVYQLADAGLLITYSSSSNSTVLGYCPNETVGKNVLDMVHPDDTEKVRAWLNSILNLPEQLSTTEYRTRNKDGKYIWVENNARNMFGNESIKAIVMNLRDIQAKKVADDALVLAEQRLSLLLNNTEESFILLNSRLRIVTYNKAAQERSPFFYNTELQSGLSVLDIIAKEEIPEYIHLFEQVFKGREIEKESKFVDNAKNVHIYSHTYRPLVNLTGDIQGVFITSTEITERKRLAEEVALHSDMLKKAQTIARLGYLEFDIVSKTFFCSDIFYEVLGLTSRVVQWEQLAKLIDCIHSEDRERVRYEIRGCYIRGKDFNIEFRFTSGGSTRVILAIGGCETVDTVRTSRLRITLQDITDSKMAVLALQTLESKFRSLFEYSIDGVILTNEAGEIVSANPSICKMLGYTREEIVTLRSSDLVDVRSPQVAAMRQTQNDTGSSIGELPLKHKDGDLIPGEVSSVCMRDGNGELYLSTIIRDITEKKKIESEQQSLTEELLKNNQDLQQFSFITSHNLRAPVANLVSLLSLYNKENPLDEFNLLLIEKFEEATQQLNQTLNDLVNVLVIKSNNNIERETISLTQVFHDVKKNIERLLDEKNGTITADFSTVDQIEYNRIHIESIFLNMISNSIRYSVAERPPEIRITSSIANDWIIVEFADNGLGIDLKRYGDRLFGLYQRFHGNKEGKGLGLYMTRAQVLAMGGKIEVESEPGKGSNFKIYFKLHE